MCKKLQLFILPFAGGSSASFTKLVDLIDERIEVITIEYAGRGKRHGESFFCRYDDFLDDVVMQIKEARDKELPYAMMGYSAGSAMTYDILSHHMIEGNLVHAFVCAKGSLYRKIPSQFYWKLPDEEFTHRMIDLGGIDERLLKNKRFLDIYMVPVRADYVVWGQYEYKAGIIPCDITAIYSPKDPISEGVKDWEQLTLGKVDYYELGENHFFIKKHWQDVADIVNSHLDKYLNCKSIVTSFENK